jgi:hypothetical protein
VAVLADPAIASEADHPGGEGGADVEEDVVEHP